MGRLAARIDLVKLVIALLDPSGPRRLWTAWEAEDTSGQP